ncbi:MAG: PAS domain S-box protein [Burkholderiales bacterium]|nr:PAS domain S-box protein [Opitutaceae bacterium]
MTDSATRDGDPSSPPAPPADAAALLIALRETEEAYRRLFDLTPLPMCVRDGETMRYLEVNHAALATYGYSREEFFTMDCRLLLAPGEGTRFEDYVARRGRSQNESYAGRWIHRRKDGGLITVEVWSHALVFHGRPARLVVVRDITEQLRAEADIRLGRERFQLIAGATSDAVWDWDFEANTLWWGESFYTLYGYHPADFSNAFATWAEAVHPDDRERVVHSLEAARDQARESWREEYRFRRKDGSYATVVDRGRIVRDASGKPHRMVGGMTDITEQSRLQKQYLRAQRMESIGTVAGGIAHDLNNMLAPILLAVEMARLQEPSPDTQRYLGTIETSARRSADLVRQVLTFARGVEGQRVPVRAGHIVQEAARFATETFPRNFRIVTECASDLWTIQADATQLNQVLLNLALNARDAMPAGGQIVFAAQNMEVDEDLAASTSHAKTGPHVVLTVADDGTGIAPQHLDHIFEPFFTTKEIGKGTGLGLPTVHAIIREHGGFITVRSELGAGSAFRVHLPARPDLAIATPIAPSPASPARPGAGELILVIDDEAALRDLTRHTLESRGYSVIDAGDGAEGVALFAQHRDRIALVLTDMAMPVMDGAATISALRRIEPRLPIVATSGHDPSGRLNRSIQAEIRHFLPKPFNADQLLAAIRIGLQPTS